MTFDKEFITRKLHSIAEYDEELGDLLKESDLEIRRNKGKLHIAERLVQLIVDSMIDINQHLIKEKHLRVADDFQSTFYILAENNILPDDFAEKIAPVVGLRNRVVHRYEELDKKLFLANLRNNFDDFKKYLKYIDRYLKK